MHDRWVAPCVCTCPTVFCPCEWFLRLRSAGGHVAYYVFRSMAHTDHTQIYVTVAVACGMYTLGAYFAKFLGGRSKQLLLSLAYNTAQFCKAWHQCGCLICCMQLSVFFGVHAIAEPVVSRNVTLNQPVWQMMLAALGFACQILGISVGHVPSKYATLVWVAWQLYILFTMYVVFYVL